MNAYKVAILIPVYGVEKTIERCARSAFEQSFKDIQYVFVNDCTKDNSIEILKTIIDQYPERKKDVFLVSHEQNMGLSNARNTALSKADATFVFHLDSDDYIDRNAIEILYEMAIKDHLDMVVGQFSIIYRNKIINKTFQKYVSKKEYLRDLLIRKSRSNVWNILIKKDIIINNEIYSIPGVSMAEDYVVLPRYAYYAEKIGFCNYCTYFYVQNPESMTNRYKESYAKDIIQTQEILETFFKSHSQYVDIKILDSSKLVNKLELYKVIPYSEYIKYCDYAAGCNTNGTPLKASIVHYLSSKKLFILIWIILNIKTKYNQFFRLFK